MNVNSRFSLNRSPVDAYHVPCLNVELSVSLCHWVLMRLARCDTWPQRARLLSKATYCWLMLTSLLKNAHVQPQLEVQVSVAFLLLKVFKSLFSQVWIHKLLLAKHVASLSKLYFLQVWMLSQKIVLFRGVKKKKWAHIARPHHCRGQFSTCFGSQEGTLALVLAPEKALEGTLACVLAAKRAI